MLYAAGLGVLFPLDDLGERQFRIYCHRLHHVLHRHIRRVGHYFKVTVFMLGIKVPQVL